MRCAYQDVDCEQCPVKANCNIPSLVRNLEQQIASIHAEPAIKTNIVHIPTRKTGKRDADL